MEKLLKELRELLANIKEYKSLDYEERTPERRDQNKADMLRIAEIEADIEELKEIEAIEARNNESINTRPETEFNHVTVEDQPIYRGSCALGQQMVDIAAMTINGDGATEARSRFEQLVNREKVLAEKRAAGTGGHIVAIGSDGGFLLQGETSTEMVTNGFNNSEILRRTAQRNIGTSQFVELIGVDETSRATGSRGGGVRVYTDAELDALTQSKTKFKKTRIEPKRLTGMYFASNEILTNAPLLQGEMSELFNEEFAFKGQDLVIHGSGVGEALGLLNAGALVTQAKESGQTTATIVFENIIKMKSRIRMRNRNSLIWLANQDTEPQYYQLSLPVGTGGSVMPIYIPNQDATSGISGTLAGIPIIFVEQCQTLGTVGDLILADWSLYWSATKGGMQSDSSMHLKFDYNQTAFRFITYFDGQPKLSSAITPYKGTATVSPFVALASRT